MNKIMRATILTLMTFAVINVVAQPNSGRRNSPNDSKRGGHMIEYMTKELDLTEAQQKEIEELHKKLAKDRPLPLRSTLERGEKPTEKQIEERKAEMDKFDVKIKAGMKKILSKDQFTKWEELCANHWNNMKSMRSDNARPNRGGRHANAGERQMKGDTVRTCPTCGRPFNK